MRFTQAPASRYPAPQSRRRSLPARLMLLATAMLTGCSTVNSVTDSVLGAGPQPGTAGYVSGFLGGVAADEPRAALAGREMLSTGGNAADAATAMALTLMVTLPSRAGIGGGGACLAYFADPKSPNQGKPEAVIFTPLAPAATGANADRPAAVPMMARGFYLLQARYGTRRFETLVPPAEQMARFGVPVSRELAKDIAVVAGPLMDDPNARAVFSDNGKPLAEGQLMRQPDLGATLGQIRQLGVGDMYQGALAHKIADESPFIGGPIAFSDMRGGLPRLAPPLVSTYGNDTVDFLPPPADGGLGAQAAFESLVKNPGDLQAAAMRSVSVVGRYRAGGVSPQQALADTGAAPVLGAFPASTSFVAMDRNGNTVACALTMDNLFGTGRVLPGTGILAAVSPATVTAPLLAVGIAWNEHLNAFRAAAAGSGQAGASEAVSVALYNALKTGKPMSTPVPDPGRANVVSCPGYLPGEAKSCDWANDPRENGLALGEN